MKFQNCILINFVMDARTDGARTDKPKAICPFTFSKVGGIMRALMLYPMQKSDENRS